MHLRNGFTLIELLIVIAIIGILAALTVPKIGSMADKAREQTCRNNLRQLQTAVHSYANDHSGNLPYAHSYEYYYNIGKIYQERRGWVSWIPSVLNEDKLNSLWSGESAKKSHSSEMYDDCGIGKKAQFAIMQGTLFDYVGDFKSYVCPVVERAVKKRAGSADDFTKNEDGGKYRVIRTYAMNPFFGAPNINKTSGSNVWRREEPVELTQVGLSERYHSNIPVASKLLLFAEIFPSADPGKETVGRSGYYDSARGGDHQYDCCINPNDFDSSDEVLTGTHTSPDKHVKGVLAVFLDGHIEMVYPHPRKEDGSGYYDKANTAWFLNRGFTPAEKDPTAN